MFLVLHEQTRKCGCFPYVASGWGEERLERMKLVAIKLLRRPEARRRFKSGMESGTVQLLAYSATGNSVEQPNSRFTVDSNRILNITATVAQQNKNLDIYHPLGLFHFTAMRIVV
jgi:hypothetical protein